MRADAADTLHQCDGLDEIALLAEFFDSPIVVTDENLAVLDLLAFDKEPCMNRLFKGRMIRPNRNGIAPINLVEIRNNAACMTSLRSVLSTCNMITVSKPLRGHLSTSCVRIAHMLIIKDEDESFNLDN